MIKEHLEKFGVEPKIIGVFWYDAELMMDGIVDAINKGKPYNKYEQLSKDDQKLYDEGELFFN